MYCAGFQALDGRQQAVELVVIHTLVRIELPVSGIYGDGSQIKHTDEISYS